jgi:hypothetical protein
MSEETTATEEEVFVKMEDLETFLNQINMTLMSIVSGINQTIEEIKRSSPSDDNED